MLRTSIRYLCGTLCYLIRRFLHDDLNYHAAALAYAILLAVVPLGIVGVTVLSYVPALSAVSTQIQDFLLQNFVATSAATIGRNVQIFIQKATHLSWTNFGFLVIILLFMLRDISQVFHKVWHTRPRFHISLALLWYLLILIILPLVLGILMIFGDYLLSLYHWATHTTLPSFRTFWLFHDIITFLLFTLLNWLLPSCKVRFIHAAMGGFFSTVCFETARRLCGWFWDNFSTYALIYGALAAIPLFLVWLYIAWCIVLSGAVLTHALTTKVPLNAPWWRGSTKLPNR
ncbi:MAG: hypothetical protein A3J38_05840 [Gammaproteobacteria bacterium RIFCSPHIGHO2_12_FULL_45_9]|nr:MAG: hypothetical protein A3J38_05840 [Gammaproteobacteria bacterium RIFCSPHIGHO2_12_FULL_45_9]